MLKFCKTIIFLIALFLFISPISVLAQEKINLYFFYGDGCPHCDKEEKFLNQLEAENKNINIYRYEVWNSRENADFLVSIGRELGIEIRGVPILIIGDQAVSGYYNDKVTGAEIKKIINNYFDLGCSDIVASLLTDSDNNSCIHGCSGNEEECIHDCGCAADTSDNGAKIPETVNVPIFGEISVKDFSLPLLTFVVAAIDGFNPCAMWVLLFLISLLINMEDKTRMWTLGAAFIVTSGAVYFLFLSAWLNLFLFLGFVVWIRTIIGLTALFSGGYHLYDFYNNREGVCKVTGNEKRKKIFERLRLLASEKKFLVALGGIILLAVAVNLVELICSAGLPAVYTQVLALAGLPTWQYYSYLVFYIFIFMLDDLLVFFIAMATLRIKAVSSRYTRWSGLIGGIVMVIIGILLLFKPGWIMFG